MKFKRWRKTQKNGVAISSYEFDKWDSVTLWQNENHVLILDSLWIINMEIETSREINRYPEKKNTENKVVSIQI